MSISTKVSGAWQTVSRISAKVSGAWQNINTGYVNVSGTWQVFYSNFVTASVFSYTGSDQTFTVPSGVTSIKAKVWGAGGAGSFIGVNGTKLEALMQKGLEEGVISKGEAAGKAS